jgi:hypothetical protein
MRSFREARDFVMLQAALGAASHDAAATRQLLDRLPPLGALTGRHPPSDQPAWLKDAVMASRMQFLMNVLTACAAAAPQVRRKAAPQHSCVYGVDLLQCQHNVAACRV